MGLARQILATVLMLLVLGSCGGPTPTPEPALPPRPVVPDGWRTITSDEGDAELAVPPEVVVFHTAGSIHGSRDEGDGVESLTVAAIPAGQLVQPRGNESVEEWADAGGWLTAGQGQIGNGEVRRRDLLLPGGAAIQLTSTYRVGELGDVWTMLQVVRTTRGYALLQISGHGTPPEEPPEEIRLIRDLVRFGG